jgi:membrane associated rhomboid family serine protease
MEGSSARHSAPVVRWLLIVNIGVFLLWWFPVLGTSVMTENLLVSWSLLAEGRVWVLLTSVFSHNLLLHLLVNMVVLMSFGPPMEEIMGSRRFLRFYLLAGIVASVAHATTSRFLLDQPDLRALGASGALAGILMLFSLSFPKAKVLLFFIIPLPAIVAVLGFVAIDVWGLVAQIGGGTLPIGHGAHLGGGAFGLVYYLVAGRDLKKGRDGAGLRWVGS